MQFKINIMLKQGILDPQGEAISNALKMLNFDGFSEVKQGKVVEITVEETDKEKALNKVISMCEKLLVNTVIENYKIEKI